MFSGILIFVFLFWIRVFEYGPHTFLICSSITWSIFYIASISLVSLLTIPHNWFLLSLSCSMNLQYLVLVQ